MPTTSASHTASATPTTSAAPGSVKDYIISPKGGATPDGKTALLALLDEQLGRNNYRTTKLVDLLWVPDARETLESRDIERRGVWNQLEAVNELKMFSTPPGSNMDDISGYQFEDSGGSGITVYYVDSGYYTQSPEYSAVEF